MKRIYLKHGKEESLLRRHPWVFSGALQHADTPIDDGQTVQVFDSNGRYMATGHYQPSSIAVRILTFDNETIDRTFWQRRLQAAYLLRQTAGLLSRPDTNAYRLVHGEGDLLPGLVIDVYGHTAVMQAHSTGMHLARHEIAAALQQVMAGKIDNIYYKSETTLPYMAQTGQTENGFLVGGDTDDVAQENGLRFHVDWLRGQKTGFFVDQRDNRALLEQYARGRRVLNMFCYTGGFSFYAMRGGAETVHSVDSSAKAIELTRNNVELNFPDDPRHQAYCEDAFRFLERVGRPDSPDHGKGYDLIILDPPAFAKHRGALHNALKGYIRLNAEALSQMKPGSLLFTFSCSQVVTKDHFRAALFTAAAQAGRDVSVLQQLHQPADHPINIYHPEGEYLKGLLLYVR
ncbi:MAG: class I SAM-dependent rRNA methyltransferase [Prevotella sp.]|nr:class I SAM-dependent rRNA methyltransferase [Prevotella sp.]